MGTPIGALTSAFTVPKSSVSLRTTSKVKFPSTPGISLSIGTIMVPCSSVVLYSGPILKGLNKR